MDTMYGLLNSLRQATSGEIPEQANQVLKVREARSTVSTRTPEQSGKRLDAMSKAVEKKPVMESVKKPEPKVAEAKTPSKPTRPVRSVVTAGRTYEAREIPERPMRNTPKKQVTMACCVECNALYTRDRGLREGVCPECGRQLRECQACFEVGSLIPMGRMRRGNAERSRFGKESQRSVIRGRRIREDEDLFMDAPEDTLDEPEEVVIDSDAACRITLTVGTDGEVHVDVDSESGIVLDSEAAPAVEEEEPLEEPAGEDEEEVGDELDDESVQHDKELPVCPECGGSLVENDDGTMTCPDCQYSSGEK